MLETQDEKEIRELVRLMFDAELEGMERDEKLQEAVPFSETFRLKMERLIKRQRQKFERKTAVKYVLSVAAVFLLVLCLVNPAGIAKAWDMCVTWYRSHIEVRVHIPKEEKGKVISEYELTYVPEGFMLMLDEYDETEGYIQYNKGQQVITLVYSSSNRSGNYQQSELTVEKDEEGNEVFVIEDEYGVIRLLWYSKNEKVTFLLYGDGRTKEEMFKIKGGITIKEKREEER